MRSNKKRKKAVLVSVVIILLTVFLSLPVISQEIDFRVINRMSKPVPGYKDIGNINVLFFSSGENGFFGSFGGQGDLPPMFARILYSDNALSLIPIDNIYTTIGGVEKSYLIMVGDKQKLLTYDYLTGQITETRDISSLPSDSPIKKVIHSIFYYQNDIGYIQKQFYYSSEDVLPSEIGVMNFTTFEERDFPIAGVVHAISADKEYLLIDEDENASSATDYELKDRDFLLFSIRHNETEIGYGHPNPYHWGDSGGDIDYGGCFVGNENILVPCGPNMEENYWLQPIGAPELAVKLILTVKGQKSTFRFSPDFTRALCEVDHIPYLVDATPLRDWLMTHNLLFKETTAKVTDTHIRVRENPNLQAKHMGFLEQGETVKVLDRSGPKEAIDPWGEHPWYRIVQESDGLSGWCFGAFLDLAEEQGELRNEGEGMVTVYEE